MRTLAAVVLLSLVAEPVAAQGIMDDPARRRLALPAIRTATNCIAREALSEAGLVDYVRNNNLDATLNGPIRRCQGAVDFMVSEFDRIYFYGAGETFLKGPYRADLPRAILARIGSEVERRQAERDRQQEADARRRQEEELLASARRAEEQAASEQRLAERKLELARIESDRRAEKLRQDDLRRQEVEAATKAADLLKDRMYACATRETNDMVRSGEGAEVIASAAMTLCSREIDQTLDAILVIKRTEAGTVLGASETEAVKAAGRVALKERVLAMTVKAKAARAN